MRIGINLIRKLNESNHTQTKFTQIIGKDQSTVSRICSNLLEVSCEEVVVFTQY
jgi:hypothetical protein